MSPIEENVDIMTNAGAFGRQHGCLIKSGWHRVGKHGKERWERMWRDLQSNQLNSPMGLKDAS